MSKETAKALEDAVRSHYKSEIEGGFMTDFFLAVAGVPDVTEEMTQYLYESGNSPIHSLIGLVRMGLLHLEGEDE